MWLEIYSSMNFSIYDETEQFYYLILIVSDSIDDEWVEIPKIGDRFSGHLVLIQMLGTESKYCQFLCWKIWNNSHLKWVFCTSACFERFGVYEEYSSLVGYCWFVVSVKLDFFFIDEYI